jgi:hypothetical protein
MPSKTEARERGKIGKRAAGRFPSAAWSGPVRRQSVGTGNASLFGGLQKSKIEVGLDQSHQTAFSARRTMLRWIIAIEKDCIKYSKR